MRSQPVLIDEWQELPARLSHLKPSSARTHIEDGSSSPNGTGIVADTKLYTAAGIAKKGPATVTLDDGSSPARSLRYGAGDRYVGRRFSVRSGTFVE